MAYRCGSCGHFAGLDEPEMDAGEPEYDGSTVTVGIEATYPSTCCGDTVGTASYEATGEVNIEHLARCKWAEDQQEAEYAFEAQDPVATDRFEDKDRRGKPIKSARYQRHYYGVEVEVTVTCDDCGAEERVTCTDESGPPEEY